MSNCRPTPLSSARTRIKILLRLNAVSYRKYDPQVGRRVSSMATPIKFGYMIDFRNPPGSSLSFADLYR